MAQHNPDITDEFRVLRGPLRVTLAALWAERVLLAFWPLMSLCALAVGLMLLVDAAALAPSWRWGLALGSSGLALGFLGWGIWVFRRPTREEAFARMDAAMPGQPIAALRDRLVLGHSDATTRRIWRAHLDRMKDRLTSVRPAGLRLDLRRRDPLALRLVAVLALVAGLAFGSVQKLTDNSVVLSRPGADMAAGPSWEGWVEPPGYTGKPPLYLADLGEAEITVPEGSTVTVRLYGPPGSLTITESLTSDGATRSEAPDLVLDVRRSGALVIDGDGGRTWQFSVTDDAAPFIAPSGVLQTRLNGEWLQPYQAGDDYGVNAGFARIALDLPRVERRYGLAAEPELRPDIELDLPLPYSADRREIEGVLEELLARHPWAGMPVTLTFGARDAALQVGYSEPEQMVLPARRFFDPLAAGLIEQRRDLLWTRANAARIAMVLRAIAYDPRGDFGRDIDRERLRAIIRKLEGFAGSGHLTPEFQDQLSNALWGLAVAIEEGNLSDALERLQRAQDRLDQAMRDGATPDEIDELMSEFREALNDYIRQLAEQSQRDGDQTPQSQNGNQDRMEMNSDQLDQMLNRLQELMEQGRMAEAQQLMEMLREMMENMQVQQSEGGQQGEGQQALEGLSETLRQQQGLSDDTFSDLQEGDGQQEGQQGGQQGQGGQPGGPRGQGEQGNQPGGNGQNMPDGEPGPGEMTPGGSGGGNMPGLAERQEALRQQLEEQLQRLPGQAGEGTRRTLDEAGRAMDRAEGALRQGDLPGALDNQADAMDALREGMQELADQMARDQEGQQGQAAGRGGAPERADPLGREAGNQGRADSQQNLLQGQDVYRRAEDLLQELRKRSGERQRSEQERDYLNRLLERF